MKSSSYFNFNISEQLRGKMKKTPNFKFVLVAFVAVFCLLSFVSEASAQKRRTTRRTTRKPAATTPATPPVNSFEIKEGSQKVATQIKNVSKFIYVLGGIASNIEAVDADIKARRTTRQTTIDQNAQSKQAVVQSIRNLRAGLAALEEEFRTKNSLRIYAVWTDGISTMTEQAERQASAGQMTDSGKTLLIVVEKLTDALAALP